MVVLLSHVMSIIPPKMAAFLLSLGPKMFPSILITSTQGSIEVLPDLVQIFLKLFQSGFLFFWVLF
ncbi:hypothetical protein Goshw_028317, partial [Gossypium schwendimanii]|nr:hypothetical protein [Gossypium schwendimanii]